MSDEANLAVVGRLITEAWNQNKLDVVSELVVASAPAGDEALAYRGADGIRKLIEDYRKVFPSTQLAIVDQAVTGDRIAVRVRAAGGYEEHEFVLFVHMQGDKIAGAQPYPPIQELARGLDRRLGAAMRAAWHCTPLMMVLGAAVLLVAILFVMGHFRTYADGIEKSWLAYDFNYFNSKQELHAAPAVSNDGRWIVFASDVANLVEGDTNATLDIFLYDRKTYTTTRISESSAGEQADGWSDDPSISPDGRYVVFASAAGNLVTKEAPAAGGQPAKQATAAGSARLYIHDVISRMTFLLDDVLAPQQNPEGSSQEQITATATSGLGADAISVSLSPVGAFMPAQWWMPTTRWERQRLYDQYERVHGLAKRHLAVVMYYYREYFVSLTMAALSVIVAAICLALISRTGWSNAATSPYLIALFIVMTASSILFGAIPNFFEFSKNIEANKKAFVVAATLENQIRSYVSTGKLVSGDGKVDSVAAASPIRPDEFIMRVDRQLVELFALPVEMNPDMVPDAADIVNRLQMNSSP